MRNLFFSLFIILCIPSFSQWNQVNIGTTQDLYSVDYYSGNDIWIGSFNQFIKTSNGGSNWIITNPMKDMSNASILPANVNDICLINSTSAIATGIYYFGNSEVILKTVNGGTNWDQVSLNNSVPLLRYINSVDMFGGLLVSVGNTGRIFRSTNAGSNWTLINSGTTNLINDVKFSAADTLFASGTNIMLRSFDGGLNWQSTVVSGDFENLACKGNVIYAVQDYGNGLIKSTDNGVSFANVSTPFLTRGGIYCLSKQEVIVSGSDGLYITRNGGTSWEKYQLSNYQPIKMIDFLSPSFGYAVGLGGYVINTGNINLAPTLPIASFNVSGSSNYCLNDNLNLNNQTYNDVGYTYQWQYDGIDISTTYNSSINLSTSGTHTISLIVYNSFGSDTSTQTINVIGNTILPINLVETDDSVCVGNYMGFYVQNSQSGVSYQLRNGSTNIGTAQSGNGGTLTFSCGSPITINKTFNIKATKTSVCFVDTLVTYKTIYTKTNPVTPAPICTPANSQNTINVSDPGINRFILGGIDNTSTPYFNHYFNYTCCYNTDLTMGETYSMFIDVNNNIEYLTVWLDFNNSGTFDNPSERIINCNQIIDTETVFFTIPTVTTFNQNIRLRVVSNSSSSSMSSACSGFSTGEIEDYYVTILPAPVLPIANFTISTDESCTTTATFTNTSYNGTNYIWDFGDGSPLEFTSNASHVYSLDGNYTITLIASNPTGNDTISQNINIVIPIVPIAACTPSVTSGYCPINDRPTFEFIYQHPSGTWHWMNSFSPDYTCDIQYTLESDSTYTFVVNHSDAGYFVGYIDANNNGVFEQTEGLGPNCCRTQNTSWGSGSTFVYLNIPAFAEDSIPLRLRLFTSTSFIGYQSLCNNYCGDYIDMTVFLTSPELEADFTAYSTNLCVGDSIYLNLTNKSKDDVAWLWDFGDGDFSSVQDPQHYYTDPGVYTVKLTVWDQDGNVDSLIRTNYISVLPGLANPIIQRNGTTLYTLASADSYQWYLNNNLISGATDSFYVASLDGTYKVIASLANGCSATSGNYSYLPPHVNFNPTPVSSCVGSNVYLGNASTNCTSYTLDWGDGTPIVNFTTGGPFHVYNTPGVYTVKLKGCGALGCDSLIRTNYLTVNALPVLPVITFSGGQLSCASVYTTYQWYRNGSTLSGATSNTYIPTLTGNYTVKVTNSTSCQITSAIYAHFPIVVNFSSDTLSYCGVNSAEVSFTNTTTNATSYIWYFGDGNSSTLTSPVHTYTTTGMFEVKLVACGTSSCDSLIMPNYITIDPNPFEITITPSTTPTMCYGLETILAGTYVTGATYQWYNYGFIISGENDTLYSATEVGEYYLQAVNSIGCVNNSDTVLLNVDYDCVWPGDTDLSSEVDEMDIIPIGLMYGETGIARNFISNDWLPFASDSWGTLLYSWLDLKHIDCNGDGIINSADTLAIDQNFSSIHNFSPVNNDQRLNVPPLYFETSSFNYEAGDWVDLDIMAGTTFDPVENLYGIGVEFFIELDFIEPGTAKLILSDSWLSEQSANGISVGKVDVQNDRVHFGITRINHININGYGKLATLRFQVLNSLSTSESINCVFYEINANDSIGNSVDFNGQTNAINFYPSTANVDEIDPDSLIEIYPNPFSESLFVTYELNQNSSVKIEILNSLGENVYQINKGIQNKGRYNFELIEDDNNLPTGIYFIKFIVGEKENIQKIIKTN